MGIETALIGGGLLMSAAGGVMQMGAARKQAKANAMASILELRGQYEQVGIQNEQLLAEAETIKLAADAAVEQRYEQLRKIKTNNLLTTAVSGLAENMSIAAADKASDKAVGRDVTMVRYNEALTRRNVSNQIRVNRMGLQYGGYRAAMGISQGTANTIGVGAQAGFSFGQSLLKYAPSFGG